MYSDIVNKDIKKEIKMFAYIKLIRRKTLRNIEIFIFICIFGISLYVFTQMEQEITTYDLINQNKTVNLTCHYMDGDDALPVVSPTFTPAEYSIFFHDTSCKGSLNSRQMCAVESAARIHPDRQVYVFFSGPVTEDTLVGKLAILLNMSNVFLARIHIKEYAQYTPAESLIENGTLKKTNWGIENTSNVLRYLTLYKYSGVYLDTDMVVVKSLDFLGGNWIGKEDKGLLNSAAFALDQYTMGRLIAKDFIEDIVKNYKSDNWVHNGPGVATRVLAKYCGTNDLTKMTLEKCQGFSVLEPKYLYPIHYSHRKRYFKTGKPEDTPDAYIHHFWNRLTHHLKVPKDSLYASLAKKFCPSVYELYDEEFGI